MKRQRGRGAERQGRREAERQRGRILPCAGVSGAGRSASLRLCLSASLPLCLSAFCFSCSDGRTPLVIYSPHGRELLSLSEQVFEAARPDVDVRWLDMGSQDALDRVRSEKANPQADVWWGGPSILFSHAAAESLLAAFRPDWSDAIAERGRAPGDFYFAVYETPAVIAYNTAAIPESEAPNDWEEVLEPRWTGKVLIRDPLASGTMRAIWGMIIERSLKTTGDTAAGFAWLRRLDGQTREYVLNPALLHEKLLRREGVVTLWDLPDILVEQSKGRPFGYKLPTSGTPVIEDAIAIVRGTRRPEVAREFVSWVGSVDAQLLAARRAFRLPARLDLPPDSLPAWARDVKERLVIEAVDWNLLSREGPGWMTYWDRNVRGRFRPTL